MFKFLPLLLLGFIACTWAMPINEDNEDRKPAPVEIIRSVINKESDGGYQVDNASADGIERKEEGNITYDAEGNPALEVHGSYSYVNEFGETVVVNYTAGVNGFVPTGNVINKEISDVAAAAKDLPKYETEAAAQYGKN
ncbi:hypothetical protein ACLKA6_009512 [Drosophila palustris]